MRPRGDDSLTYSELLPEVSIDPSEPSGLLNPLNAFQGPRGGFFDSAFHEPDDPSSDPDEYEEVKDVDEESKDEDSKHSKREDTEEEKPLHHKVSIRYTSGIFIKGSSNFISKEDDFSIFNQLGAVHTGSIGGVPISTVLSKN